MALIMIIVILHQLHACMHIIILTSWNWSYEYCIISICVVNKMSYPEPIEEEDLTVDKKVNSIFHYNNTVEPLLWAIETIDACMYCMLVLIK